MSQRKYLSFAKTSAKQQLNGLQFFDVDVAVLYNVNAGVAIAYCSLHPVRWCYSCKYRIGKANVGEN